MPIQLYISQQFTIPKKIVHYTDTCDIGSDQRGIFCFDSMAKVWLRAIQPKWSKDVFALGGFSNRR